MEETAGSDSRVETIHKSQESQAHSQKAPLQAKPFGKACEEALRARISPILLGFDNLTVLVEAAVAANAVRKLHFAALRANGTSRSCHPVVNAATCMSAGAAHLTLRYCHNCLLL